MWRTWALNFVSWIRNLRRPSEGVRVAWTCSCGKRLRITAAQQQLKGALEFAKAAGPSGAASIQITPRPSPPSPGSDSGAQSLASSAYTPSKKTIASSVLSLTSAGDGDFTGFTVVPRGRARFLLLCVRRVMYVPGRWAYDIVPSSLCLTNIDDSTMFDMIRKEYYGSKPLAAQGWGSKLRYLERLWKSFRVPKTVEYVKFTICRQITGLFVDKCETDEIPSVKQVYDMEYIYRPCPLDVGPHPIPPEVFMHWFLDPGDHAGDRSMAVERLPKKLYKSFEQELEGSGAGRPQDYWGIYIVDGFNWARIQVVLLVLLLVTFRVLDGWSGAKNEVQGGMGLGQFSIALVVACLTVSLLGFTTLEDLTRGPEYT